MLKKRIAATLVIKDSLVVQSLGFNRYMPVGKPAIAMEFFDNWGIDEIILLDIGATRGGVGPDYAMVRSASARCRVPLTVGGGIANIDHILGLMHCGADKISLNQTALHQPALLREAANRFGAQCVVVSIDTLKVDGSYYVYDYLQRKVLSTTPTELARQAQEQGAGEILINSVERDGARCGFDLQLINDVCAAVTVPVICCGGAGKPEHFIDVLESTPASAVAAANFFHFTEHSVTTTKALIRRRGLPVRHESYAGYKNNSFDDAGRLLKKTDTELEELLYSPVVKEVI